MKSLVICESPNKIKTLENILGKDYIVLATKGHILDLKKKELSIDINHNFIVDYKPLPDKKNVIDNLKNVYKNNKFKEVYLAGDIDYEGTFINWSVKEILGLKNPRTLEFICLTKDEVEKALKKETYINYNHLEAQKTRRVLDRLCGFKVSPEIIKLFGPNNSFGRVQTVVAELIVDKEIEIKNFLNDNINNSFYNLNGQFIYDNIEFNSSSKDIIEKQDINDLLDDIQNGEYYIDDIEVKELSNKPPLPFNTSSIQQFCNSHFGLSSKSIMDILQKLFEKGFITYHRTTSIQLSKECLDMVKDFINNNFKNEYYKRTLYKDKDDNTENSHEAIRYTDNKNTPESLKDILNDLELKVYTAIYNNTIQSQMPPEKVKQIKLIIKNKNIDDLTFTSTFNKQLFNGYKILNKNDNEIDDANFEIIENIQIGENVDYNFINAKETYKNPPSRYTEASLINKLSPKNLNIGRPSTYASMITKIQDRNYVELTDIKGIDKEIKIYTITKDNINNKTEKIKIGEEKKKLKPTELGIQVVNFSKEYFKTIMDYKFTSIMEEKIDKISEGKLTYLDCISDFYKILDKYLQIVGGKNFSKTYKSQFEKLLGEDENHCKIFITQTKFGKALKKQNKDFNPNKKSNKSSNKEFIYANLDNDINDNDITLDYALNLFKYPFTIFKLNDEDVILNKGRFGFYITYNKKNYHINNENITKEEFENLLNKKNEEDKNKIEFKDNDFNYKILNGKFGYYILCNPLNKKSKSKNINISLSNYLKNNKLEDLNLDIIHNLFNEYKNKPKKTFKNSKSKTNQSKNLKQEQKQEQIQEKEQKPKRTYNRKK